MRKFVPWAPVRTMLATDDLCFARYSFNCVKSPVMMVSQTSSTAGCGKRGGGGCIDALGLGMTDFTVDFSGVVLLMRCEALG